MKNRRLINEEWTSVAIESRLDKESKEELLDLYFKKVKELLLKDLMKANKIFYVEFIWGDKTEHEYQSDAKGEL